MAQPANWRGEWTGFHEDDPPQPKFSRDKDKDKEWEGDPARFSCLLRLRHGTGREQRYGPRYRMLSCGYNDEGTFLCTASEDKTARVFDRVSQKQIHKLIHSEVVRCAAFSHSGRYIATGADDAHCRMFPMFPEEDHPELKKNEEVYWLHHSGWLTSITFAKEDRLLLTTCRDRVARLWDIGNMDLRLPSARWRLEDPVLHAAFSPDQTRLAFASGAQRYFGVLSVFHAEKGSADGGGNQSSLPINAIEHPDCVSCVAFSPNHRYLASGCLDGEARIYDMRNFDQVASFKHPNFVRAISFTTCNKCICTFCEDGQIRVFEIAERKELQVFDTSEPLSWGVLSPSGLEICTTSTEGQLQVWGVEGRISRKLKEHQRYLEELENPPAPDAEAEAESAGPAEEQP